MAGTGSRIIAATDFLFSLRAFSRFFISLNLQIIVFLVKSFGIPGDEGDPNVVEPDPAWTNKWST